MILEGKVALVTGSSSGIGAGIAVRMAAEGADIVVNYHHNAKGAERTAELVRAAGRRALVVRADVGNADDVQRMFLEIDREHARLDVLVNNAGVTLKKSLLATSEGEFDSLITSNLKSVFLCSKEAAKRMIGRGGAILNISSIHAATTTYGFGAYGATKGGMESLTRAMAIEFGEYGINVNALRLGIISVERDPVEPGGTLYEAICGRLPVGRPGEVEDVTDLAVLLCSSRARFVSGTVIDVDGGARAMMNTPYDKGFGA